MTYEKYQSEGSSRWNVRSISKTGKKKFLRGFRTEAEADFFISQKKMGVKRALI